MTRKITIPPAKGLIQDNSGDGNSARDGRDKMSGAAGLRPGAANQAWGSGEISNQEKSLEDMGHLLKTKREINGLSRRDIVVKIKIPLDQLESIEDGRLSSLPPVFAKGFLRAYANELGLDAEALLDDYRKMTGGFKNEPASREPLAPRYVETSVGSSRWRPGPRLLVGFILVIAAVAAGWWLWPGAREFVSSWWPLGAAEEVAAQGSGSSEQGNSLIGDSGLTEGQNLVQLGGAPETTAPMISGSLSQPASETFTPDDETSIEPGEASMPVETAPVTPAAPAVLDTPTSLTLTSTKDKAWAEVMVDGRSPQYFWFASAGDSAKVIATESIIVTSGTANDLLVLWDGQEELGPLAQSKTARVRFPK